METKLRIGQKIKFNGCVDYELCAICRKIHSKCIVARSAIITDGFVYGTLVERLMGQVKIVIKIDGLLHSVGISDNCAIPINLKFKNHVEKLL